MAWTTPMTWSTGAVVTAAELNEQLRDNMSAVLPIGTLILRVAAYSDVETAVESRWLQCNGAAVSRTTYAALFNYLSGLTPSLPFGTGDGLTTFNLPDMRGRTVYAEGTHVDVDDIGDSEGSAIGSRTPAHRHIAKLASVAGNPGNLIVANSKDTGQTASPQAVGSDGALEKPAYLVVGSYFIKYTA